MNRCLRDQTLLLLNNGEGTSAQRTHLTECEACAARYQQLGHDIDTIGQILREGPPSEALSYRFRPLSLRWLSTVVAAALALVLMWQGVRMWNPFARPHHGTDNGEFWRVLDDFPSNLFSLNEAVAVELWSEVGDFDRAAAALEADRPCEWYDLLATGEVESSVAELETLAGTPLRSCVEIEVNPRHKKR
jgi:hypothetical protein